MKTILVDSRNIDQVEPLIIEQLKAAPYAGFDIETEDSRAHQGIKDYRKGDTAKVFDTRRTTVTGFSIYTPGSDNAWYVNIAHADVENRVPVLRSVNLLRQKPNATPWIIHNSPFEETMCWNGLSYDVGTAICTLQMAVSAFGPDEYPADKFSRIYHWDIHKLIPEIVREFRAYEPNVDKSLTTPQAQVLAKVVGKDSIASWSYNGFVRDISYGYNLKKLVMSLFGHKMTTFEETLNGREHMGQLAGYEVAAYGGDDSYWAVQVFERLLTMMSPAAMDAFIKTENPMTRVYADIWKNGININLDAVKARHDLEVDNRARLSSELKNAVHKLLPFPESLNEKLVAKEKWYREKGNDWRQRIIRWGGEYEVQMKTRVKILKDESFNPTYFSAVRTILYDLCGLPLVMDQGKVQSDGEARGRMFEKTDREDVRNIIGLINKMASVDQALKLYLRPYQLLTDPETKRIYPSVSSKLATRRMASSFPNPMQLAKRGSTVYVRGFYEADGDDYLIISLDWSQVELVLIGEFSGDPEFTVAYGQLPYEDLHLTAACAVLEALYDKEVTKEKFKLLKSGINPFDFALVDEKGQPLSPEEAYKFNRGNPGGKGANFEYWYSGWLANLAQRRGLGPTQTADLVHAYESRFKVAVEWRNKLINDAQWTGKVLLPDGHERRKFEATPEWQTMFSNFFGDMARQMGGADGEAIRMFGQLAAHKIKRRSYNQLVNAMIQGTCATLAKRSRLTIGEQILEQGLDARFLIPIHDELVWVVRKDHILPFLRMAKAAMANHPTIVKNLKLNTSASIGRTFEPFHNEKVPFGQIELDEAPKVDWIPEQYHGKSLPEDEIEKIIWRNWR